MVQIETLPNGVRLVTEAMDTVRSAALGIWVGGSSRALSAARPRTSPGRPTPSAGR